MQCSADGQSEEFGISAGELHGELIDVIYWVYCGYNECSVMTKDE